MAQTTIGFGIALILLGLGGYFGTGAEHPTAIQRLTQLIPFVH